MGFEFLSGPPQQSPTGRRGAASGKRFVSAPAGMQPVTLPVAPSRATTHPVELPPYRHSSLKVRPGGQVQTVVAPPPPAPAADALVSLQPRVKGKRRFANRSQTPMPVPIASGYSSLGATGLPDRPIGQTQAKHALFLRRKAKQASVTQRRLRSALRLVMIASTLIFVPLLMQAAFWRWTVKDTVLRWDGYTRPAAVTEVLAPFAQQPLWAVNPLQVEAKLAASIPVLASVQVRRHLLPARIEVVATEHRPWALLFAPQHTAVAATATLPQPNINTKAVPSKGLVGLGPSAASTGAHPFGLVAETHQVLGFPSSSSSTRAASSFNWQGLSQGHPQVPIVVAPSVLAALPIQDRTMFFNRLHTVMTSLQAIPRLAVRYVTLDPSLAVTVYFDKVSVQLGVLDSDDLSKAGRLNPLIRTLTDEQLARLHAIDLRWNKNVFWH
jgi:POTRA domain, FtsQ-type